MSLSLELCSRVGAVGLSVLAFLITLVVNGLAGAGRGERSGEEAGVRVSLWLGLV